MGNNWIEWKGGYCPVPKGMLVDVKYRSGEEEYSLPALENVSSDSGLNARNCFWVHDAHNQDIIAWRPHQPEQVAWNGEGLPPVGSNAEALLDNEWRVVKVVYAGEPGSKNEALVFDVETTKPAWADEFRPIRTEAERKREEAIQFMSYKFRELAGEVSGQEAVFSAVYDAIAAGKIPGVKLED